MARKHEMISAGSSIPEGMFGGNDSDIVGNELSERSDVVGVGLVEVLHQPNNAERHEVKMSGVGVWGPEMGAAALHLADESSLARINALAWSAVD